MSPKIVDKEVRKKEITLAAMRIMAKVGFQNVKIDEIAAAAGIGKGTVYEYFSSKEEVFSTVMTEFMQTIETKMAQKMFRAVTPQEKITSIVTAWMEVCEEEDEESLTLMLDIWSEGIRQDNPEFVKLFDMKELYYRFRGMVSGILTEGMNSGEFRKVDPVASAGIFLASVDGLIIQWLLDRDKIEIRNYGKTLVDLFINGIINTEERRVS